MKYQTKLMEQILTNATAQDLIDYVSRIYGESYVGLWVYQVIGMVLGEVLSFAEELRSEAQPSTAVRLLDLWERHYGITPDPSMTPAQRQARLMRKTGNRSPASPARLAQAVAGYLGFAVEIQENTDDNTFTVVLLDGTASTEPVMELLRPMKPAQLLMDCRFRYLLIRDVEAMTLTEMDATPLRMLAG